MSPANDSPAREHDDVRADEEFPSYVTQHHTQLRSAPPPVVASAEAAMSTGSSQLDSPFALQTTFTVAATWMRSSFENAQSALPVQEFQVKGFRPGKAPKQLIEKRRAERARELATTWVVDDLRRLLADSLDVLILSPLITPAQVTWESTAHPLSATFTYAGWLYPTVDLAYLTGELRRRETTPDNLRERTFELISREMIPAGIEALLMADRDLRSALPDDAGVARAHLRQALVNNLLVRAFDITVSPEDIERAYGEYAIEHSLSFVEAEAELEPMRAIFIQKLEADKAYAELSHRVA